MKKYLIIGASALIILSGIIGLSLHYTEPANTMQNVDTFVSLAANTETEEDTRSAVPESTESTPSYSTPTATPLQSPTPEPTPKVTPTPTTKATPKSTPKATTKATPKPTPKPSPKAPASTPAASSNKEPSQKALEIINTAKSYMGVPYVWGGSTPDGFDCSGFIQYVFDKNGISLPRVTADQYKAGTSISKSDLIPGDLIFFETYKAGPSHVGIYLGNNQFIHASSGKGEVTISNYTSTYYTEHYIGCIRVIN